MQFWKTLSFVALGVAYCSVQVPQLALCEAETADTADIFDTAFDSKLTPEQRQKLNKFRNVKKFLQGTDFAAPVVLGAGGFAGLREIVGNMMQDHAKGTSVLESLKNNKKMSLLVVVLTVVFFFLTHRASKFKSQLVALSENDSFLSNNKAAQQEIQEIKSKGGLKGYIGRLKSAGFVMTILIALVFLYKLKKMHGGDYKLGNPFSTIAEGGDAEDATKIVNSRMELMSTVLAGGMGGSQIFGSTLKEFFQDFMGSQRLINVFAKDGEEEVA